MDNLCSGCSHQFLFTLAYLDSAIESLGLKYNLANMKEFSI